MRTSHKSIVRLCVAVCTFCAALQVPVFAQVNVVVSYNPTEVIATGLTEVMGEVRLTSITSGTTMACTLSVVYQSTEISNPFGSTPINLQAGRILAAGGVEIEFSPDYRNSANAGQISAAGQNTVQGGQILISIPEGIGLSAGAAILVRGARGNMVGKAIDDSVNAWLSASPSNAYSFSNVSVVRVAVTSPGLSNPGIEGNTIVIREGMAGAFVQSVVGEVFGDLVPVNLRPAYGANANVQVHVLAEGCATLAWPGSVPSDSGFATLRLHSVSPGGGEALYEFVTIDQGGSDTNTESFALVMPVTITKAQVQLYPAADTDRVPRFQDPLRTVSNDPLKGISALKSQISFLVAIDHLRPQDATTLQAKLDAAEQKLRAGNVGGCAGQLKAFIAHVQVFITRGLILATEGKSQINAAQQILESLAC